MITAIKNTRPKDPIILSFETVLRRAIDKHASDIHLKSEVPPVIRVNGDLFILSEGAGKQANKWSREELDHLIQQLLTATQLQRYQNGEEVDLGYELPGVSRFRINLCLQRGNPRLVCRMIPDQIQTLEELGLPPFIKELTSHQRGMILVTGSTGSGKSTTLAGMIQEISTQQSCHIVTLEDPIEFVFKDRKSIITQREIGLDTLNFPKALKYAMRQDPDVILVGEMRDEETILMAMAAAETGHLVLSTLHTVDASETVNRILGVVSPGMQNQARLQLAAVLVAVVSQRLIPRADGSGRVAAIEILLNNERVKEMILDPSRTSDLHKVIEESTAYGMCSFDQSLMELCQKGIITKEEAMNHCTNLRDFQLKLDGIVSGEWREKDEGVTQSRRLQVRKLLEQPTENTHIEIDMGNSKENTNTPPPLDPKTPPKAK